MGCGAVRGVAAWCVRYARSFCAGCRRAVTVAVALRFPRPLCDYAAALPDDDLCVPHALALCCFVQNLKVCLPFVRDGRLSAHFVRGGNSGGICALVSKADPFHSCIRELRCVVITRASVSCVVS